MIRLPVLLSLAAACALGACGGGDDAEPAPPVELPPAGGSRWASIEHDDDADGQFDRVTMFEYDERGLRLRRTTIAFHGVEPTLSRSWHHDAAGRVRAITGNGYEYDDATEVVYDDDGRLARTVHEEGDARRELRFLWSGGRIAGYLDASSGIEAVVDYGADGRVAQVVRRRIGQEPPDVDRYVWRDDGQLQVARFSESVGRLVTYTLEYDAAGRHRRTTVDDDGIRLHQRRHVLDERGRTVRIEIDRDAVSLEDADFVADEVHRIEWEDGPCQPVHLPEPPPSFDRELTAEASSERVSPGCAD